MRRMLAILGSFLAALILLPAPGSAQIEFGIVAVVDDVAISAHDLEARLNLVITSANLPRSEDSRRRLRPQVLRILVDEELQKIAARRAGVTVPVGMIDEEIDNIAQRNNMTTGRLTLQLERNGVDMEVLRQQVLATLAWQRFLATWLVRTVDVSEDEVDAVVRERNETRGQTIYRLREILLTVNDPANEPSVLAGARRLAEQIRAGGEFGALAQQFSAGPSAGDGGEVGWMLARQMGPEIAESLPELEIGKVSDPIRTAAGYTLIEVREKRVKGQENRDSVVVNLAQILVPVAADAGEPVVDAAFALARAVSPDITGCDGLADVAASRPGLRSNELGEIMIGNLPGPFQGPVSKVAVGGVSEPVRSTSGVHLVVVCGRSSPLVEVIDRDRVREEILRRKLNQRALSYLRDLRRDIVIDYR